MYKPNSNHKGSIVDELVGQPSYINANMGLNSAQLFGTHPNK